MVLKDDEAHGISPCCSFPLYSGSRLPHLDHLQGRGAGRRAPRRAGPGEPAQLRDEAGEGRAVETVKSAHNSPPLCSPTLHTWPVGHHSLSLLQQPKLSLISLSPLGFSFRKESASDRLLQSVLSPVLKDRMIQQSVWDVNVFLIAVAQP